MRLTLGNIIASLNARRHADDAASVVSKAFERLSTGLRINRASDDAAGLAISEQLSVNSRLYTQAIRNLNDGISMLQIREQALGSLESITERISELAVQASNGVYSNTQRRALDAEAQALWDEFSRIQEATTFNGQQLLSTSQQIALQAGITSGASDRLNIEIGLDVNGTATFDGTFEALGPYDGIGRVQGIIFADMNNDGNMDAISYGSSGSGTLVSLGNGDGTFQYSFSSVGNASNLHAVDIDGDGDTDIVGTRAGLLAFYQNSGTGQLSQTTYQNLGTAVDIDSSALSDINGDGNLDFLFLGSASNVLYTSLGNGDGSFSAATSYATGITMTSGTIADFNNDGYLDAVGIGSGTDVIMLGQAGGTFAAAQATANLPLYLRSVGDINGDGFLDLVGQSAALDTAVRVSYGDGAGNFTGVADLGLSSNNGMPELVDINNDGNLDVFRINDSFGVSLHLGNGNGTFKVAITDTSLSIYSYDFADLNNDGVQDVGITGYNSDNFSTLLSGATQGDFSFSLQTQSQAREAVDAMKSLRESLSAIIGNNGAQISRLEAATKVLHAMRLATEESYSRIASADIATESSALLRFSILQKSALAVAAQANNQAWIVLGLLA